MIIILSGADDPTADRVASELTRRSARYARLDLSDFPQRVVASACLDGSGHWTGQIRHAQGWAVAWEDITAVYYRRPSNFQPPPGLTGADRRFVVAEARGGFGGVLASLDAQWVNHPFRVADSEFKPIQLIAAQACGFAVPATVITNDGRSAHSFAESRAHDVVYKPLGGGFYRDNDDNVTLIYATPVPAESLDDAEIAATSHTFQSFIDKAHDVRVTVAGPRVFGVAIHSTSAAGRIDWRSDYGALRYTEIPVPDAVSDSISRYLHRFGLLYGAFDFSIDHDGRWWFLECNPNGQWGFIAQATGMPIASAIADLLTGDTTIPATEWQEHLDIMITGLRDRGALTDLRWIAAFRAVPRHVFTPQLLEPEAHDTNHDTAQTRRAWLSRVYQDDSLITAITHEPSLRTDVPTSSSTRPSLMARMLEVLQLRDGMRVLEIGTGTGYNAGLLTHRLGDSHVTSIDIEPALIDHARRRLRSLNLTPHLLAGDGIAGVADRAPFDRIIATCAIPGIPLAWITQLTPGGAMLVNLRGEIAGGTLCLLSKDITGDNEVIGSFLDIAGHFMWARHDPARALPYDIHPTSERDQTRTITKPETVTDIAHDITNPHFRFLAQFYVRGIRTLATTPQHPPYATIHAETTDGSWATAHTTTGHITQGGTRRLWDTICAMHTFWRELGQPSATRFGIVANPTTQFAYLDHDHNWTRWPLPLL